MATLTIHFPPAHASSEAIHRVIRSIDILGVISNDHLPEDMRLRILRTLREWPGTFEGSQFVAQATAAYELAAHDLGYVPTFPEFRQWISTCHGFHVLQQAGGGL